jgi:SH3 domain protein
MKHSTLRFGLALTLSLSSLAAVAQEYRYVSDKLFVPLRSGMGSEFRITHRGLPSGTKLTLLEEKADDGWSLVRTDKGKEGWVQNQYILNRPIAAQLLIAAEAKMSKLSESNEAIKAELKDLRAENKALNTQLGDTQKSGSELSTELRNLKELSANTLQLNEQHKVLIQDHQLLQTERDSLTAENEQLKSNRSYQQWIYGAGIMLAGVLLTILLQARSQRKNYSEWA